MGHMVVAQDLTLTTSNVADDSTTAWAAAGSADTGDIRRVTTAADGTTAIFPHRLYEALADGVTSYPPTHPSEWLDLGAINRHKMFDGLNNQRTVADAGEDITVTVVPEGRIRFVYFVGLRNVRKIDLSVTESGVTSTHTSDLLISYSAVSWSSWLYDIFGIDRNYRRSAGFAVVSGTRAPLAPTVTATLYSRGADQPAECGQIIMGNGFWLGDTEWGVEPELKDYSTYNADEFGNRVLVPRQTTRNMRGTLWVPTNDYDRVFSLFESRMNQLALFDFNNGDDISASEVKDALRVHGKLTSLTGGLAYNKTPLNLSIEGGN